MELEQFGFGEVSFVDGERIESSLNLGDAIAADAGDSANVMLLTNQRVIHIQGDKKSRKAVFAAIHDINSVEVSVERRGNSAFIWAALAFVVAVLLLVVVNHPIGRLAAAAIVALMGVYLIVDHLMTPGAPVVIFKAGSSEFRCDLKDEGASSEVYAFINRLFQLKSERPDLSGSRAQRFAPR